MIDRSNTITSCHFLGGQHHILQAYWVRLHTVGVEAHVLVVCVHRVGLADHHRDELRVAGHVETAVLNHLLVRLEVHVHPWVGWLGQEWQCQNVLAFWQLDCCDLVIVGASVVGLLFLLNGAASDDVRATLIVVLQNLDLTGQQTHCIFQNFRFWYIPRLFQVKYLFNRLQELRGN